MNKFYKFVHYANQTLFSAASVIFLLGSWVETDPNKAFQNATLGLLCLGVVKLSSIEYTVDSFKEKQILT